MEEKKCLQKKETILEEYSKEDVIRVSFVAVNHSNRNALLKVNVSYRGSSVAKATISQDRVVLWQVCESMQRLNDNQKKEIFSYLKVVFEQNLGGKHIFPDDPDGIFLKYFAKSGFLEVNSVSQRNLLIDVEEVELHDQLSERFEKRNSEGRYKIQSIHNLQKPLEAFMTFLDCCKNSVSFIKKRLDLYCKDGGLSGIVDADDVLVIYDTEENTIIATLFFKTMQIKEEQKRIVSFYDLVVLPKLQKQRFGSALFKYFWINYVQDKCNKLCFAYAEKAKDFYFKKVFKNLDDSISSLRVKLLKGPEDLGIYEHYQEFCRQNFSHLIETRQLNSFSFFEGKRITKLPLPRCCYDGSHCIFL